MSETRGLLPLPEITTNMLPLSRTEVQIVNRIAAERDELEVERDELQAAHDALKEELAQVKAERDEAVRDARDSQERCANDRRFYNGRERRLMTERDTAISHVEAVLEWSNTERFAGRTRHEDDAPSKARAFLLSMREKADQ